MADAASLTDLRLVLAIDETGSIGGADDLAAPLQPAEREPQARRPRTPPLGGHAGGARHHRSPAHPCGSAARRARRPRPGPGGRGGGCGPLSGGAAAGRRHHRKPGACCNAALPEPLRGASHRAPAPTTDARWSAPSPTARFDAAVRGTGPGRVARPSAYAGPRLGRDRVVLVGTRDSPPGHGVARWRVSRWRWPPTTTSPLPLRTGWRAGVVRPCGPRRPRPRWPWLATPGWLAAVPHTALAPHGVVGGPARRTQGSPSTVTSGW